jgi:[acyl-carrier-protein] S-malonyltransferase
MEMICIACPGQGSQAPGFLEPWLEIPVFKKSVEESAQSINLDLIHFGTVADAETIRDTKIAQPLIVAAGIASFETLKDKLGDSLDIVATAGHSVGEITAAYVSGIFDSQTALEFVQRRGNEMADAAGLSASSMAAVVGGELDQVLAHLDSVGLFAANYNGAGQVVAAGSKDAIASLVASPPAGSRVVALQVAGAFHTSFMEPARPALKEFATQLNVNDPKFSIWSNSDGQLVGSGQKFLDLMVNQVSNPVRWDKTMESMTSANVSLMIELVPGGALSGIAKRAMSNTVAIALKTPADLDKVAEAIGK